MRAALLLWPICLAAISASAQAPTPPIAAPHTEQAPSAPDETGPSETQAPPPTDAEPDDTPPPAGDAPRDGAEGPADIVDSPAAPNAKEVHESDTPPSDLRDDDAPANNLLDDDTPANNLRDDDAQTTDAPPDLDAADSPDAKNAGASTAATPEPTPTAPRVDAQHHTPTPPNAPFPTGGVVGAVAAGGAMLAIAALIGVTAAGLTFLLTASFCPAWQIFAVALPALFVGAGASAPAVAGSLGPAAVGAGAYFGARDETMRTRTQLAAAVAPGCALGAAGVCGTAAGGALVALSLMLGGPFVGGTAFGVYALVFGALLGGSSWAAALFAPPVAMGGVLAQAVQLNQFPAADPPTEQANDAQLY